MCAGREVSMVNNRMIGFKLNDLSSSQAYGITKRLPFNFQTLKISIKLPRIVEAFVEATDGSVELGL